MAINYPGPYEWRLVYQTLASSVPAISQMRLSVNVTGTPDPGEDYAAVNLTARDTTTTDLDAWEDALVALLQPLFHTTTDFVASELWKYTPGTFEADYVTGRTIGLNGSSSTASTQDGQAIISYRTTTGGRAKAVLMQPSLTVGVTQTFPTGVGGINNLSNFLVQGTSPVIGRDGGFFLVPYKYNMGLSETLFKRRLRF